jgi:hypothetical protein
MITTTYESRYLLINFITQHKILVYSLNSELDKLNQITFTRRPISSTYFLKLLKEVYNVNSNTIIGITGNYNMKGQYFSLLYGYAIANNIRIRKLDFYQSCERVNFRYKIINSTNKIIDWYKKYYLLYNSLITKKSIKFIDSELLNIIDNRSNSEKLIFKKSLILLMYIHIREELYKSTKKCILKNKSDIKEEIENIIQSENRLYIIT